MIESNLDSIEKMNDSVQLSSDSPILDSALRPRNFGDYIGQDAVVKNLLIAIRAAAQRGDSLDHILLHGPPGLGKTTLASIVATELGVNLKITSGPALEKQGDIAAIISNLEERDVWFIDEIHRLKPAIEEVLYSAMEDYRLDIVLGKGPSARTMSLNLPKFTLIGATTKISMISSPLRDRFGSLHKLEFYSDLQVQQIILRSASLLNFDINEECAMTLAKVSRRTPRIANRLLKRVRDYAEVYSKGKLSSEVLASALSSLGIDERGLDERDREILSALIDKFSGGPVGLGTLAASIAEEKETIEDVYEPYLIQLGLLERTARGRLATQKAYELFGL